MATNHNLDISVWTLGVSKENRSKALSFQSEEVTESKLDDVRSEPSAHAHWLVVKILCCQMTEWMSKKKINK